MSEVTGYSSQELDAAMQEFLETTRYVGKVRPWREVPETGVDYDDDDPPAEKRDVTNEPRDAEGKWTQTYEGAVERIKALGIRPYIGNKKSTTIRTAHIVADVLEEMKKKGYRMPDAAVVRESKKDTPTGVTTFYPGMFLRDLVVELPESLPEDANLDDAVTAAFGKDHEFAARSMRDLVIHEMGHVQSGYRPMPEPSTLPGFGFRSPLYLESLMGKVSDYAGENHHEFLAEMFTRLYRGEPVDPQALKLYNAMQGPAIK